MRFTSARLTLLMALSALFPGCVTKTLAPAQGPVGPAATGPSTKPASGTTAPSGTAVATVASAAPGAANSQVPPLGATSPSQVATAQQTAPAIAATPANSGDGQGVAVTSSTAPAGLDSDSYTAIFILNTMRAARGLPAVMYDAGLTERCNAYAQKMASSVGLNHDQSVYFTDERENIAEGNTSVQDAMDMWLHSPPHAAAMFDENGFPTAVLGGYGSAQGYSCLRLCPVPHAPEVCNG